MIYFFSFRFFKNKLGGQKARLSLCRACYAQDKQVFLLDDPLSAVDAHVAKHIFDKCIKGLLANKTRIISTHHIKYLIDCDQVLVVDHSMIVDSGPGHRIIPKYLEIFKSKLMDEDNKSIESYISLDEAQQSETENLDTIAALIEPCAESANVVISPDDNFKSKASEEQSDEIEEEAKEQGAINIKVYKHYCKSVGYFLVCFTLLTLTLMQLTRNLTDFWLSYWTEHSSNLNSTKSLFAHMFGEKKHPHLEKIYVLNPYGTHIYDSSAFMIDSKAFNANSTNFFFIVYGCLCLANTFFTLLRSFGFAFSGIVAGKRIHKRLVENLSKVNIILVFIFNTK